MTTLQIIARARKLLDAAGRRAWKQELSNSQTTVATNARCSDAVAQSDPSPIWMETEARVTECHRENVRLSPLTLRTKAEPKKVIVFYSYYAHAKMYYDCISSPGQRCKGKHSRSTTTP
jgi:hypothetical protein